ncbi:MAG TPA: chemotaxis protein CheW [Myxococcaceae bacterium]|nr:chemotaxis protein CheW [Myxococcaceae bacterium]
MSEPRQSHLVFACGTSWYAVPADRAAEVVSLPELTRVPGAPPHLLGVFAHRGEVIPVVDLATLVGGTPEAAVRAVLLRLGKGSLALTATKVAGVSLVSGKLDPLGTSGVRVHLKGPARSQRSDVAVIDPEGLFEFLSQGS